jgi:signal transduction histidine kinase
VLGHSAAVRDLVHLADDLAVAGPSQLVTGRRIAANRCDGNNASMSARVRQAAWTAAALVVPVALSVALLPLRAHVDDVLVAVVLLAVSAAVLARAEWPPRIVAGVSAALSFNYFYAQPYDQFGGGVQAIETTVVLGVAIPALAAWAGRLSGQEAAREKALREQAERNAAELAERQRQVERLAADLTASRRRIVAAGDEMRRRIERNLHDGVQQRLVTVSLRLGGVRDRVPEGLPAIRDDLGRLADILAGTLDELRDLARGVHPAILAEAGLGAALDGLARRSAVPVRLHLHAGGRLPAECEATAYYVVCEAFANAVKHARGSAVDIGVDIVDGMLTVRVSDDGVGGADSRGSGLTGIRDRVEAVGGTLAVHSPPGSGTVLTARLPPGDPFG